MFLRNWWVMHCCAILLANPKKLARNWLQFSLVVSLLTKNVHEIIIEIKNLTALQATMSTRLMMDGKRRTNHLYMCFKVTIIYSTPELNLGFPPCVTINCNPLCCPFWSFKIFLCSRFLVKILAEAANIRAKKIFRKYCNEYNYTWTNCVQRE